MRRIRRVAVLGSGVMGSAIAAHFANVGIPSLMLDIVPKELTRDEASRGLGLSDREVRNRFASMAKLNLQKLKPAPLYTVEDAGLIEIGNLEDDFQRIADCDWIIEVVVEQLAVKQALMKRIDEVRTPGTIVSSNTSGVSIAAMAVGRSDDFRAHFLGTHFFNPPRYMKLLEIIPTSETLPEIARFLREFAEGRLGKGVVIAKDTPNFVANRIGTFGLLATLEEMSRFGLGVDDVDALTGPVMGRPKSATFRTLDLVGIDTFVHVADNVAEATRDPDEKVVFTAPDYILKMVEKGWIGEKRGQGFFKREKTGSGREILVLDIATMEYRPRKRLSSPTLEAAKAASSLPEKLQTLVGGSDSAGQFAWNILKRVLLYSAELVGVIADDIIAIDRAMEWGFNWELGPFATWDALGVRESVARMEREGHAIPPFVRSLLDRGESFYGHTAEGLASHFTSAGYAATSKDERRIDLRELKNKGKVIFGNRGASLIDIGDGVACLEFHSPKEAIGADLVQMILKAADEVEKNFEGLVVGSERVNFSVGANLMMVLMEAQDDNWDEIDLVIRQFQQANMRLKYLGRPVVMAPYGLTLGGGAEIAMSGTRVVAAAETYMGLVETGVGLIPGGGGTKELLLRALDSLPAHTPDVPVMPAVQKAFETIALAKVSTSAKDARNLGYLRSEDGIAVARDFLLYEAKSQVLTLTRQFAPKQQRLIPVVGDNGAALLKIGVFGMKRSGYISDHDEKIAKKLIRVLTGGDAPAGTAVSEQYLLDLEREAFLSLCGEPLTQARMQHTLKTGKPLRN